MQKRTAYLLIGVSFLAAAFCLFVYGRVITPLIKRSRSNPVPTYIESPAIRTTQPSSRSQRVKSAKQLAQQPAQSTPVITPSPAIVREQRPVYQPPVVLEQPQRRELSAEQCTERINRTRTATDYIYIPPECQEQYRQFQSWQRDDEYRKQRQAQQEQRERQDAELRAQRQAQQQQRDRENAERQRQQRVDRTMQNIQGIIRGIKRKP